MKLFILSSLAGAGFALLSLSSPQTMLEKQAAILKEAKSLRVTYTLQHLPGSPVEYKLTYSKPSMVLIEGPDRTLECDGKTLWQYNKATNTYTETPVTAEVLAKKAQNDEVIGWASFFSEDFAKHLTNLQGGATRMMKENSVTELTFTTAGVTPRTVTLYIDDKLGIARGMSVKGGPFDLLARASSIEIGKEPIAAEKFAFVAPSGATKTEVASTDAGGTGFASVQAVFQNNCGGCHGGPNGKGGFSIASYQSVMTGARSGPVITPGDADNSRLIQLITGQGTPKMPPTGNVSADDIAKIKAWIQAGAKQ
jgi:outer membrane lipoprotein-sorting protein